MDFFVKPFIMFLTASLRANQIFKKELLKTVYILKKVLKSLNTVCVKKNFVISEEICFTHILTGSGPVF